MVQKNIMQHGDYNKSLLKLHQNNIKIIIIILLVYGLNNNPNI
jgi:hypothetical protein